MPAVTTMDSRTNGLGLIVSLDSTYKASGELYWDEGDSIEPIESGRYSLFNFSFENNKLKSEVIRSEITEEFHKNQNISYQLRKRYNLIKPS